MHVFSGETPNEVYPDVVRAVLAGEQVPSRVSSTRELHPAIIEIRDVRQRVITSFGRPVNVPFALAEVLWILGGRDDVAMLEWYNSKIGDYSDNGTAFNAAYGRRLRTDHGLDQLDDMIAGLRHDPHSRQAVLNIWHPGRDRAFRPARVPGADNYEFEQVPHTTKDRACNLLSHALIRNGRLDWMQVMRSNDAIWGLPYNIIQWSHVHEFVTAAVDPEMEMGSYWHIADSLHVYDYHQQEAASIRYFDLYDELEALHRPLSHEEATREHIERALVAEELIRTAPEWVWRRAIETVGWYWFDLLSVLGAFRLYKDRADKEALLMLTSNNDSVYASATIRHMYYWRWHKPEYQDLLDQLREYLPVRVYDWITAAHA